MVHAELVMLAAFGLYALAPRNSDILKGLASSPGESIDVGMVDPDAARRIVADLERQEEEAKAEEVKKEVESIKAPGQVVDVPVPREERRPDDARFASEHDTTVEKETKKLGKFDEKARQGDLTGDAAASRAPTPPSKPTQAQPDDRLAMRVPTLGRALRAPGPKAVPQDGQQPGSEYGAPAPGTESPEGAVPRQGGKQPPRPNGGGAQAGAAPSLMPTPQTLAKAVGSGSQDALRDIDDGDETALNSKKWKFASFFNRVKKQVADHWHPEEAYRRRDPTGAVYGRQNRYTLLRVQLKPDGTLANLALEQPSGLEFLDDEAMEAFKQAQPFPNPPHQLLEGGKLINFSFGFLFDLNGAPKMYHFKY
ncbi:MAG TPA: TonB family protein [Polyangia bacterium]|nr:TonB family protein [Polyangia bacterium]